VGRTPAHGSGCAEGCLQRRRKDGRFDVDGKRTDNFEKI
jgi:hypothetical protein